MIFRRHSSFIRRYRSDCSNYTDGERIYPDMKSILYSLTCVLLLSCGVDSTEIGADFFHDGRLDVAMVDSSTVRLSTVMLEDVSSNGKDRLIVGSYEDLTLGRVSAIPFIQFGIESAVTLPTSDVEYESLQLVLKNDGYSFYDTTAALTFSIHTLSESIEHDDDGVIYTSDFFDYADDILGSVQIFPRPNRVTEYEIPLADEFGQTLFEKAQLSDPDLADNTEFLEFFKGLALVPDESASAALLGLNSAVELRLYYRDKTAVPTKQKFITFSSVTGNSFTHVHAERDDTALGGLTRPSQKLSAEETDDASYIQGGTALALRIDLPYLRSFRQHTNFYLTKAVLQFSPVRQSYNGMNPLSRQLLAYRVDETNELYNTSPFTADLIEDYSLSRDTYYEVDVTSFVKEQMDMVALNENGLLFILNNSTVNVSRISVAAPSNLYTTKLKIYYATINE
jgi:hypothetical protein